MTKSSYPSMQRIAELQQFIADFAKVLRVQNLAGNGQRENDVEHSFGLALTCWFLHGKIAPGLNLGEKQAFWQRHKITQKMAEDKQSKMKTSPIVAPYYEELVAWMSSLDYFYKPGKESDGHM